MSNPNGTNTKEKSKNRVDRTMGPKIHDNFSFNVKSAKITLKVQKEMSRNNKNLNTNNFEKPSKDIVDDAIRLHIMHGNSVQFYIQQMQNDPKYWTKNSDSGSKDLTKDLASKDLTKDLASKDLTKDSEDLTKDLASKDSEDLTKDLASEGLKKDSGSKYWTKNSDSEKY